MAREGEAVAALEGSRTQVRPSTVVGLVEARRGLLHVPAGAIPRDWFPHYAGGSFNELRGSWGATYGQRLDTLTILYRALNQPDTKGYRFNDDVKTAIDNAVGEDDPADPNGRERLIKTAGILFGWLRNADYYWERANSLFGVYSEATIPEIDTEKIDGEKLQVLVDAFGPGVITYGQALYREILRHPVAPPSTDKWTLDDAITNVGAALTGPAPVDPVLVALRAQINPLTPDKQAMVKLVGQQLFRNMGGASEANRLRELGLPPAGRYLLTEISSIDPWSSAATPLRFWHDVKGLYQLGEANVIYQYLTDNYSVKPNQPATPWGGLERSLADAGVMSFGNNVKLRENLPLPAIGGVTNVKVDLVGMIKRGQRNTKVVETMKEVMDSIIASGDSKGLGAIPSAVAFRYPKQTPYERSARTIETLNLLLLGVRLVKEGKKPVPVDQKLWTEYLSQTGRNFNLDYTTESARLGRLHDTYAAALMAADGTTLWKELGAFAVNAGGVLLTSKPVLK